MSEKKVYLCVRPKGRSRIYSWYAIENDDDVVVDDLNNKNIDDDNDDVFSYMSEDQEVLTPVFDSPPDPPFSFGLAAWKSFIYMFGGLREPPPPPNRRHPSRGELTFNIPCTDVFFIDTRRPQDGWKTGPNLSEARVKPHGLIYNGMICALGGGDRSDHLSRFAVSLRKRHPNPNPTSTSTSTSSADDNDTQEDEWSQLHMGDVPDHLFRSIGSLALLFKEEEEELFVYSWGPPAIHSYNFRTEEWTLVEDQTYCWSFRCTSASVGQIMYFVEGDRFMGFDVVERRWYTVVGLKRNKMLPPTHYTPYPFPETSSLIHIGKGTLCLTWIGPFLHLDFYALHCTKFTVRKQVGSSIINATVKSFKVYKIEKALLRGSLAMGFGCCCN